MQANVQQAKQIYRYKNIKEKMYKTNAVIWCNKTRRQKNNRRPTTYEGHLESKKRFTIKKYLLIIGKKKNMHVLSHTFTYFST